MRKPEPPQTGSHTNKKETENKWISFLIRSTCKNCLMHKCLDRGILVPCSFLHKLIHSSNQCTYLIYHTKYGLEIDE